MVDLKPLDHRERIFSETKFRELFEECLKDLFPPALQVFRTLGELHSFSVANLIFLGLQADCEEKVIADLLRWSEIVVRAPNPTIAYTDTRTTFDIIYREQFLEVGHTVGGFGFQKTGSEKGLAIFRLVPPTQE